MSLIQRFASLFKSTNIEMSGTWNGYYGYSEQYPEAFRNKRVQFTAQISSGTDGYFTGTIQESEEGISEIAGIEGLVRGKKILFDKIYLKLYQIDETGKRVIKDGPQVIKYEGVYIQSKNAFLGQWKIKSVYVSAGGRQQEGISFGNWSLKRE